MRVNHEKTDLVWRRLENAKQELDHAHQQITKLQQDRISDAVPSANGNNAHTLALRDHELAVTNYLKALADVKARMPSDQPVDLAEPQSTEVSDGENGITPRELEVLGLIASGKSSRQIADHLGIAFRTVVCHRYRLQTKLKVHNTADLMRAALRMRLIDL
jgi:DNA-binding NarL/FixJ family response regulator